MCWLTLDLWTRPVMLWIVELGSRSGRTASWASFDPEPAGQAGQTTWCSSPRGKCASFAWKPSRQTRCSKCFCASISITKGENYCCCCCCCASISPLLCRWPSYIDPGALYISCGSTSIPLNTSVSVQVGCAKTRSTSRYLRYHPPHDNSRRRLLLVLRWP